jgi:hypothetical protein
VKDDTLSFFAKGTNGNFLISDRDTFVVKVTVPLGTVPLGCSVLDSIVISKPEKPSFEFVLPSELCLGESVKITPASKANFVKPFFTWETRNGIPTWEIRGQEKDTILLSPQYEGTTSIGLSVQNCQSLSLETIKSFSIPVKSCGFFIPSLVIPNGAQLSNQGFYVFENTQFENDGNSRRFLNGGKLKIFNRWGKEVYSSSDYQNDLSRERLTKDFTSGIFFYEYDNSAKGYKKSGTFTLLFNK